MKDIKVMDMTCMSCVKTIQQSLLPKGINAKFDVLKHTVSVKDNEVVKAVELIKQAGYTPEVWLGFMPEDLKVLTLTV